MLSSKKLYIYHLLTLEMQVIALGGRSDWEE